MSEPHNMIEARMIASINDGSSSCRTKSEDNTRSHATLIQKRYLAKKQPNIGFCLTRTASAACCADHMTEACNAQLAQAIVISSNPFSDFYQALI